MVSPVMESSLMVLSGSVSLERTKSVTLVLRLVAAESLVATGASLTHETVKLPVAVLLMAPEASSAW